PIRVLLPSSTEPAVAMRSVLARRSTTGSGWPLPSMTVSLEVATAFAVLHGRLAHSVVGARLAALGDARGCDLLNHGVERDRPRLHGARARHVAHRAVPHARLERLLAFDQLDEWAERIEHAVALEHLALVGEVDRGDLELLLGDVLPHVELGPVREREHAHVLALLVAAVVERPQLWALRLRVPLAGLVAEAEDALLRTGALLVAARAAERGVEPVLGDRVEQRDRLEPVARGARAGLLHHAALANRLLNRRDHQPLAEALDQLVAELDHLGEVVARVHMHQRERELGRPERLLGQPHEHERVLAAGE